MSWSARIAHRLRAVLRRDAMERELDEELRFHLEMEAAQNERLGMRPDEAALAARRAFGGVERTKEECRDTRGVRFVDEVIQDVRYAARSLRRSPALAATAVLTIALGIGANTAIMSAAYALLLAPLPFANAERIVGLVRLTNRGHVLGSATPHLVDAWRAHARSLEGIATYSTGGHTLTEGDETEELGSIAISPDLPRFLGVQPVLGRTFLGEESAAGADHVVMLGHGLWQRRFAGRPDVLGRTVQLNGQPYTVVGVMPQDAELIVAGPIPPQIWTPLGAGRHGQEVGAIGRLRPGVKASEAARELNAIATTLAADDPELRDSRVLVRSLHGSRGGGMRDLLVLLAGATGFVLLIACANVANLLLARGASRQHELAIRAAIGAGRGRLFRQLLTESLLLALAGGVVGVLLAWRGLGLIVAVRPDSMSQLDRAQLQPVVLAWCLGLSLLTGILFGLAPALFATRRHIGGSLASGGRAVAGPARTRRFGAVLTMAEVALSVVLLVGAGLLVRTIHEAQRFDLGFDTRALLTMKVALPAERYPTAAQRSAIYDGLLDRVRRLPGATSATFALGVPPRSGVAVGELEIAGRAIDSTERISLLAANVIHPSYLGTIGIQLREGRMLASDSGAHEVLISRVMARRYWPGRSAVGERIRLSASKPWETIVGVVDDVYDLDDAAREPSAASGRRRGLQIYYPFSGSLESATLIIRTSGQTPDLLAMVSREAKLLNPAIRIRDVTTVDAALSAKLAGHRYATTLLAVFALMALVLSAVGLYGVIAYSVSQRTREIGVRMALGARPARVVRQVMWQGLRLTLVGLAVGLAGAVAATRVIRGQIIVSPLDPTTYVAVGLILGVVALVASYAPARRASRVDPVLALRAE